MWLCWCVTEDGDIKLFRHKLANLEKRKALAEAAGNIETVHYKPWIATWSCLVLYFVFLGGMCVRARV